MRYDHSNVLPRCSVHDLDSRQVLDRVLSVDTDTGEIVQAEILQQEPGRTLGIAQTVTKWAAVWPVIVDRHQRPVAIHCHGRRA